VKLEWTGVGFVTNNQQQYGVPVLWNQKKTPSSWTN
jgi:hypothetical protein